MSAADSRLSVRRTRASRAAVAALLLSLAVLGSCGPAGPEAAVRRMLDRGERAAEARDFLVLRELIAEDYRDNAGRDRSRLLGQARAYLRHGGSVHVYSRVASLRVVEPARAEVELLVAVAAGPIAGLADLRETSADLARVHLVLGQPGGRWQVESAEWRAAELAEFF